MKNVKKEKKKKEMAKVFETKADARIFKIKRFSLSNSASHKRVGLLKNESKKEKIREKRSWRQT